MDVRVAPFVERAVELTRELWSQHDAVPILVMDNEGHGEDMGLVFQPSSVNIAGQGFVRSELVARISVGAIPEDRKRSRLEYTRPDRVHIGIYGARQFFPDDWRSLPRGDIDRRAFTPVVEDVNVSMRWINGEYDDWSDPKAWAASMCATVIGDYTHLNVKRPFDDHRTTYCSARMQTLENRKEGSTAWMEKPDALRFVRSEGRKPGCVPLSVSLRDAIRMAGPAGETLGLLYGDVPHIPSAVGYEAVASMAGLPPARERDLRRMCPEDGVEFMFADVLPSMRRFVSR